VLVLATIGVGVGFMVQRLRIYEFQEVARLFRRGVQQRHTIERGVRIREASARMGELGDLSAVFVALGEALGGDGCPRAEVRLRAEFLDGRRGTGGGRGAHRRDATDEDDVTVWTWNAVDRAQIEPTWWHVTLPFVDPEGRRFGSLVMWEEGIEAESPFPHFHAISGDLRGQLEAKVLALWPVGMRGRAVGATVVNGSHLAAMAVPASNRARSRDRNRDRDRVPTGSGPAVPIA
jgi:hypothetical protein